MEVDDLIWSNSGVKPLYIHPVYKPQLYSVHCITDSNTKITYCLETLETIEQNQKAATRDENKRTSLGVVAKLKQCIRSHFDGVDWTQLARSAS